MSIVEFDGPPSWSERANWGEYKMPVGRGGGGHSRRKIINPISSPQTPRRLLTVCFDTLSLRPRPHYVEEMSKCSFISTVKHTVHSNPSRKQSFSKTLFKSEECENAGVAFSGVERKTFGELDYSHQLALLADDFARVAKDETACSQAVSCVIKRCLVHSFPFEKCSNQCSVFSFR